MGKKKTINYRYCHEVHQPLTSLLKEIFTHSPEKHVGAALSFLSGLIQYHVIDPLHLQHSDTSGTVAVLLHPRHNSLIGSFSTTCVP